MNTNGARRLASVKRGVADKKVLGNGDNDSIRDGNTERREGKGGISLLRWGMGKTKNKLERMRGRQQEENVLQTQEVVIELRAS